MERCMAGGHLNGAIDNGLIPQSQSGALIAILIALCIVFPLSGTLFSLSSVALVIAKCTNINLSSGEEGGEQQD